MNLGKLILKAPDFYNKRMFAKYCKFINHKVYIDCCDIGTKNNKMEFIKKWYPYMQVDQIVSDDFNTEIEFKKQYSTIFCLEVIEHLTNPELLIKEMSGALSFHGNIYISIPDRPKFLYPIFHYNEMSGKILQNWLLDKYGLRIIRSKKIRIPVKWWKYFTGIRPFMRLFFNYTWVYEIKSIK